MSENCVANEPEQKHHGNPHSMQDEKTETQGGKVGLEEDTYQNVTKNLELLLQPNTFLL